MNDQNPGATKLVAWAVAVSISIIFISIALWVAFNIVGIR